MPCPHPDVQDHPQSGVPASPHEELGLRSLQKRDISCFLQFGLELPRVCWVNSPKMLAHTSPRACVCPVTSPSKHAGLRCATVCQERQMGQGRPVKLGRKPKIADVPASRCRFERSSPPRTTSELGAMEFRFRHMEDSVTGTPHLRNRTTNHVGGMHPVCPKHRGEIAGCRNPRNHAATFLDLHTVHCPHPSQLRVGCWVVPRGWWVGWYFVARCIPSPLKQISPIPALKLRRTLTSGNDRSRHNPFNSVNNFKLPSLLVESAAHFGNSPKSFQEKMPPTQSNPMFWRAAESKEMGSSAVAVSLCLWLLIRQASTSLIHHSRVR